MSKLDKCKPVTVRNHCAVLWLSHDAMSEIKHSGVQKDRMRDLVKVKACFLSDCILCNRKSLGEPIFLQKQDDRLLMKRQHNKHILSTSYCNFK